MFVRFALICLLWLLTSLACPGQQAADSGQWRHYGGDAGTTKYSPLDQIQRGNVKRLKLAWEWSSPDNEIRRKAGFVKLAELIPFIYEATPLFVDGTLYTSTSFSQAAAIDARTGKTKWVHDPGTWKAGRPTNLGFVHRGLAYWRDGSTERLFLGTGDAYLIALDAQTGKPIAEFGTEGRIDLTKGLRRPVNRRQYAVTSPPVVCRGVVIVGSSIYDLPDHKEMPPGDVRGFDARTGKQLWTFHTIPQGGEKGAETWLNDSWKYTGNTNVWAPMSVDDKLGYVYLPVSTPTNDWYGGHRLGDNLYAESLVCVEAATGKLVWHFQITHHGLWDYDLPAAPILVDLVVDGKKRSAVAQVTKQGFCFVFDRLTGKPIWPIEERKVPTSAVPGERASPTQPFPTKPPAYERQGITEQDLIDFTPALRKEALEILSGHDHGPLYTPPSLRGTINLPGWVGGANWQGAAFDPETGRLFIPSVTVPIQVKLEKTKPGEDTDFSYRRALKGGLPGPQGLPLVKPPYGRVTALDLHRGEIAWQVPLGVGPRDHPALKGVPGLPERLGDARRGQILATKSLLFVGQEGRVEKIITLIRDNRIVEALNSKMTYQPCLQVLDKSSGELLTEIPLPDNVSGAPMTYLHHGKQYIVFPVGGLFNSDRLLALTLSE